MDIVYSLYHLSLYYRDSIPLVAQARGHRIGFVLRPLVQRSVVNSDVLLAENFVQHEPVRSTFVGAVAIQDQAVIHIDA